MTIDRRSSTLFAVALFSLSIAAVHAQMAGSMAEGQMSSQPQMGSQSGAQSGDASMSPGSMSPSSMSTGTQPTELPSPATSRSSHSLAQKLVAKAQSTHAADTPLNSTERAQQMLNRFTFGPRPGEVQAVAAMGAQKWFEDQLHPEQIGDNAVEKRIANDYPALALTPPQLLAAYPNRHIVDLTAQGKQPYPTDPIEVGLYQVLVYRWNEQHDHKNAAGVVVPATFLTDDEIAKKKQEDQVTAAHVAGLLFALPKQQRLPALMKMPVPDRLAFATYVEGDQKRLLYADFTPREREILGAMLHGDVNASSVAVSELMQAKMVRAVLSERQLQEVMTDFWFNHFNVFIYKDSDLYYTPAYERDVIRPHALGKFRDLLLATAQSPAMMVYLDNLVSIGPNSESNGGKNPNGKRGNRGLNENYAREVMELHTVGVNGGYTQSDVTQLARILTGWSVDHPENGGDFLYSPKNHEPGTKQWLGHTISEDGMNEGLHALNILASSPKTAHFISSLIAQRFVADAPPPALVDRMAKTYLKTDGDISAVLRTLVASSEFNSHRYFRNKVKTPMEFVASTFRTTATDPANPSALVDALRLMGMPLYQALPPTGYYLTAEQWMNSAALIDRLNFSISLTSGKVNGVKFDAPKLLAMELMVQPNQLAPKQARAISASNVTYGGTPGSGTDLALGVLESALIGGGVSSTTSQFLHTQANQPQLVQGMPVKQNPTDTLNRLTALVMGSPEFQMR